MNVFLTRSFVRCHTNTQICRIKVTEEKNRSKKKDEKFPGDSISKESTYEYRGPRVPSLDLEDPLEKEMTIHFSILVWKIPWAEEPGRLYSPWGCKSWTELSD